VNEYDMNAPFEREKKKIPQKQ